MLHAYYNTYTSIHLGMQVEIFVKILGVPTSFGQEFRKKSQNFKKSENTNSEKLEKAKKLWKFVYIPAKEYRSHFNLTNFLTEKISKF